jgi:hypothetical protein
MASSTPRKKVNVVHPKGTHTFSFVRKDGREETYDVYKLWELAEHLPTIEVDVPRLFFRLAQKKIFWASQIRLFLLNMDSLEGKAIMDHLQRLRDCDLCFPLILGPGSVGVVDGVHRVVKAYLQGFNKLQAKQFRKMPKEARIPNKPTSLS